MIYMLDFTPDYGAKFRSATPILRSKDNTCATILKSKMCGLYFYKDTLNIGNDIATDKTNQPEGWPPFCLRFLN